MLCDIRRRLDNTWHTHLELVTDPGSASWPHNFPLGSVSRADLEKNFDHYRVASLTWQQWAAARAVTLLNASRLVFGTAQRVPTHVAVPDIDTAARIAGPDWTDRLDRGRRRIAALSAASFNGNLIRAVRDVDTYSDTDFDLLCTTAAWFRGHADTAHGLTPRQVPIAGLHAKWLNTRHGLIAALAGLDQLDLLPRHPPRIHFTYLDPHHRAGGGRWHDSATVGDFMTPAYHPAVIVISENKDTAIHFPPLAGGIAIEGAGFGGGTAAAVDWVRTCTTLLYWGDLDAAGLEILNGYREAAGSNQHPDGSQDVRPLSAVRDSNRRPRQPANLPASTGPAVFDRPRARPIRTAHRSLLGRAQAHRARTDSARGGVLSRH